VAASVAVLVLGTRAYADYAVGDAIAAVSYGLVGALIVARRPANRIGWLFLAVGPVSGLYALADQYGRYALVTEPGSLPGGAWAAWVANWSWLPSAFVISAVVPLLFPDGRLPSARWRPAAWYVLAAFAVLLAGAMLEPTTSTTGLPAPNPVFGDNAAAIAPLLEPVAALLFPSAALVGLLTLVVRFIGSEGVRRQQLKWLVLAVGLTLAGFFGPFGPLSVLIIPAAPVAVGIAIVRHQLYDIDRILNRTLVYGLLTAILGAGYAVVVLGLGQRAGGSSNLVVAAATLAVAAVFQPLRRRVQAAVDRRFNRRRYDAQRTIEAFSARLRDQLDLDTLTAAVVTTATRTMEPAAASLWLRPRPGQPDSSSPMRASPFSRSSSPSA
jgi:hypothetical protein